MDARGCEECCAGGGSAPPGRAWHLHPRVTGRVRVEVEVVEQQPERECRYRWVVPGLVVLGERLPTQPAASSTVIVARGHGPRTCRRSSSARSCSCGSCFCRGQSREVMNLSDHVAKSAACCGCETIARRRSAGLRPAAISPATKSRLILASLIVRKLPRGQARRCPVLQPAGDLHCCLPRCLNYGRGALRSSRRPRTSLACCRRQLRFDYTKQKWAVFPDDCRRCGVRPRPQYLELQGGDVSCRTSRPRRADAKPVSKLRPCQE